MARKAKPTGCNRLSCGSASTRPECYLGWSGAGRGAPRSATRTVGPLKQAARRRHADTCDAEIGPVVQFSHLAIAPLVIVTGTTLVAARHGRLDQAAVAATCTSADVIVCRKYPPFDYPDSTCLYTLTWYLNHFKSPRPASARQLDDFLG